MDKNQGVSSPALMICAGVTRRKVSYFRCSPTGRLLAASIFLFSSVSLFLAFHTPQACEPCDLTAANDRNNNPQAAIPTAGHPAFATQQLTAGTSSVATSKPADDGVGGQDRNVVLLKKEDGESLQKLEVTKPPVKKSTKRKFRNPTVPDRPDISDEEQAKHKLAVIIPYRDRMENLKVFVPTLSDILNQQKIKFAIYTIGQSELGAFNRGKLCNIGYEVAAKDGFDYIAIHDVDKLPVSANVSYRWPGETFVHMATCVEQFNFELPYYNFLGGVVMFRNDDYKKLNGMTNIFWGFGAEDDDLWVRIKRRRLKLSRAKACDRGRFVSLSHGNSTLHYPRVNYMVNYNLYRQLLKRKRQMEADGLSTLQYKTVYRSSETLGYVNVTVDVCHGPLGRASIEETGCDGPKPRAPDV